MALATERVVVLMTKPERRALEAKVRRIRTSTAELVRRSIAAFDPEADEAEIESLLDALTRSNQATLAALDKAERELAETRKQIAERMAARNP